MNNSGMEIKVNDFHLWLHFVYANHRVSPGFAGWVFVHLVLSQKYVQSASVVLFLGIDTV